MAMEKARIGNVIYDVITYDTYKQNPSAYGTFTAIREGDMILPIRNKTDTRPGFYPGDMMDFFKPPAPEEAHEYGQDIVINFSDATTMKEVILAQQKLHNAERAILTTVDNIFVPDITTHDTPEMAALKEAILKKKIDIDKYEGRFGPNYNNDKRLLRKPSITFGKLRTMMDALDMKGTLIIEDNNPDVPNPIGERIVVQLNGDSASDISDDSSDTKED